MGNGPQEQDRLRGIRGVNAPEIGTVATDFEGGVDQYLNRQRSGTIDAQATAEAGGHQRNREVALNAVRARKSGKELQMTEKQRLMKTLFETPGRELLNIKFFRIDGGLTRVSDEDFCARVNQVIFKIDNGLTKATSTFSGDNRKSTDVAELRKRLLPQ